MEQIEKRAGNEYRIERRSERRDRPISVWQIVGGVALVTVAALVVVNLHDIRRYIRISTM